MYITLSNCTVIAEMFKDSYVLIYTHSLYHVVDILRPLNLVHSVPCGFLMKPRNWFDCARGRSTKYSIPKEQAAIFSFSRRSVGRTDGRRQ